MKIGRQFLSIPKQRDYTVVTVSFSTKHLLQAYANKACTWRDRVHQTPILTLARCIRNVYIHIHNSYTRTCIRSRIRSYCAGDLTNCNIITANLFTRRRITGNTWLPPCASSRIPCIYYRCTNQRSNASSAHALESRNGNDSTNT